MMISIPPTAFLRNMQLAPAQDPDPLEHHPILDAQPAGHDVSVRAGRSRRPAHAKDTHHVWREMPHRRMHRGSGLGRGRREKPRNCNQPRLVVTATRIEKSV